VLQNCIAVCLVLQSWDCHLGSELSNGLTSLSWIMLVQDNWITQYCHNLPWHRVLNRSRDGPLLRWKRESKNIYDFESWVLDIFQENERTRDILIEQRFHKTIIGAKGGSIRDIRDKFNQVQITFPDPGKKSDVVTIRGPKTDVDQVYKYLQQLHHDLILENHQAEVHIFKQFHKNIIGRGGSNIKKVSFCVASSCFSSKFPNRFYIPYMCVFYDRKETLISFHRLILLQFWVKVIVFFRFVMKPTRGLTCQVRTVNPTSSWLPGKNLMLRQLNRKSSWSRRNWLVWNRKFFWALAL
jgi:hypothetical protein